MKKWSLPLSLLLLTTTVRAQERIPDEEARNIARLLLEAAKKVKPPLVIDDDKEYNLALCYLDVRKGAKDTLDLVLLSKEKTPLLKAPLEKVDEKQEWPVEFTASIEGNDRAHLKVNLLGAYRAKITLGILTD